MRARLIEQILQRDLGIGRFAAHPPGKLAHGHRTGHLAQRQGLRDGQTEPGHPFTHARRASEQRAGPRCADALCRRLTFADRTLPQDPRLFYICCTLGA
jgi:hypothetical protein